MPAIGNHGTSAAGNRTYAKHNSSKRTAQSQEAVQFAIQPAPSNASVPMPKYPHSCPPFTSFHSTVPVSSFVHQNQAMENEKQDLILRTRLYLVSAVLRPTATSFTTAFLSPVSSCKKRPAAVSTSENRCKSPD